MEFNFKTRKSSVAEATRTIMENRCKNTKDPYRPVYHPIAPHGWMNDPNGLIYIDGWYHVFYQWNPYESCWGNMHWGHMRSQNLYDWEHLPVAIAPDMDYEIDGCFSGSAILQEDKIYLYYTSNVFEDIVNLDLDWPLAIQTQSGAVSEDGLTFKKLSDKPLIGNTPPWGSIVNFRDPKVFETESCYNMIIALQKAKTETEDAQGVIVQYKTPDKSDMKTWIYDGIIAQSESDMGYMWECPDKVSLNGKDVLILSLMKPAGYNGQHVAGYVVKNGDTYDVETFKRMDQMPCFYAPQTFSGLKDTVLLAWLVMPQLDYKEHEWNGCHTLPRKLSLTDKDELCSNPIIKTDMAAVLYTVENKTIEEGESLKFEGDTLRISLTCQVARHGVLQLKLKASEDGEQYSAVSVDFDKKLIALDMTASGERVLDEAVLQKCDYTYEHIEEKQLDLDIFIDKSVLEIYAFGGRCVMTSAVFSNPEHKSIEIRTEGLETFELESLSLSEMRPSKQIFHPVLNAF